MEPYDIEDAVRRCVVDLGKFPSKVHDTLIRGYLGGAFKAGELARVERLSCALKNNKAAA